MNDQNDFFEDLIDLDEEPERDDFSALAYEDDDEEETDDEEPYELRTVLLAKRDMLALLSLKVMASGAQIVRVDPRQALPSAQSYEDTDAANTWFNRSLATSRKNGWTVVYDGSPLFG